MQIKRLRQQPLINRTTQGKYNMIKIIKVTSCQTCPYEGECKAWKSLTRSQKVQLAIGNNTPQEFILAKCHLEEAES